MKPQGWREIAGPLAAPGQKHIWLTLSSQGQKRVKTMYERERESMEGCMLCSVYLLKTNLDWDLGLFWEQMNLAWDQKNLQTRTHIHRQTYKHVMFKKQTKLIKVQKWPKLNHPTPNLFIG